MAGHLGIWGTWAWDLGPGETRELLLARERPLRTCACGIVPVQGRDDGAVSNAPNLGAINRREKSNQAAINTGPWHSLGMELP